MRESTHHRNPSPPKVQFACNWYGNYGHNGLNGQFYGRFVDWVDTMDAITPCGQQTIILLIRRLCVRPNTRGLGLQDGGLKTPPCLSRTGGSDTLRLRPAKTAGFSFVCNECVTGSPTLQDSIILPIRNSWKNRAVYLSRRRVGLTRGWVALCSQKIFSYRFYRIFPPDCALWNTIEKLLYF